MTTFQQFISTVFTFISAGRWGELVEYMALVRELMSQPTAIVIAGKPRDKEIK